MRALGFVGTEAERRRRAGRKPVKPVVPAKRPRRFPPLDGCYVDEAYEGRYTRRHLQGTVTIQHYKGHMLLRVEDEDPRSARFAAAAWLDGDDIDLVIGMLRDARKVWLRGYRKTERHLRRVGVLPKRKR